MLINLFRDLHIWKPSWFCHKQSMQQCNSNAYDKLMYLVLKIPEMVNWTQAHLTQKATADDYVHLILCHIKQNASWGRWFESRESDHTHVRCIQYIGNIWKCPAKSSQDSKRYCSLFKKFSILPDAQKIEKSMTNNLWTPNPIPREGLNPMHKKLDPSECTYIQYCIQNSSTPK